MNYFLNKNNIYLLGRILKQTYVPASQINRGIWNPGPRPSPLYSPVTTSPNSAYIMSFLLIKLLNVGIPLDFI